jgi:CheY-like chemotaxis protein
MLATVLQEWGYQVIEAANGAEALRRWEQHQAEVDLLYTDMIMPGGLTGLGLAEQLRATKPGLKVIVSSGYSAELAHPSGVLPPHTTYVPKPCPAAELIAAVRRTLDQAS